MGIACLIHCHCCSLGQNVCLHQFVYCVYVLIKQSEQVTNAFSHAFPHWSATEVQSTYCNAVIKALHDGTWGLNYHLFTLSLLLDRPIFQFNTFETCAITSQQGLCLADTTDVSHFAQRFLSYDCDTRRYILYCSNHTGISYSLVMYLFYLIHLSHYSTSTTTTGLPC